MSKLPSLFNIKLTKNNPLGQESANTPGFKKKQLPKPLQLLPPAQFPEVAAM